MVCSRKLILVTGIAYGVLQFNIVRILYPLGLGKVLALQTTLSSKVVYDILAEWKSTGEITRYLSHYYLDFPLPVFYGLLLTALYSKFLDQLKLPPEYNIVILFPLIIGALDIFENLSHLAFIFINGAITPLWVGLSGTAGCVKWALLLLSLLLCNVFCIKLLIRKIRRSK